MKRAIFVLAIVLAIGACNTPTPSLRLALAGGPSQACPSTDCAAVMMRCAAVMSIRILDPADPDSPYLSQCLPVSINHNQDICAIASVDLESTVIPVRDLEVQVALYPANAAEIQSDPMNKNVLSCPAKVMYSAEGYPVEQAPTPALGGHTYYHPGDEQVVVTLGCTDLAAINESCVATNLVTVAATVDNFDTGGSVTASQADGLFVSVGEPHGSDGRFVLEPVDLLPLPRRATGQNPTWGDDIAYPFSTYACLDVFEDVAQSTATLRCKAVTEGGPLDLRGVRLTRDQLDVILSALDLASFPDDGLTVGMVIDGQGRPVPGASVTVDAGTVGYLSEKLDEIVVGATSTTASNGIFVSGDAAFGAEFVTGSPGLQMASGIGGRVTGKVTVVILQLGGRTS